MDTKTIPKHYKIYPDVLMPEEYIVEVYRHGPTGKFLSWERKYIHLEDISELIRNYEARGYIADYIQTN